MFPWTRQLSIGNRLLDSEHKKLHSLMTGTAKHITARNTVLLVSAFDQLSDYLGFYFAFEEHIAHAVNFDFSEHRQAHQDLLTNLQHMKDELMVRNGNWSDDDGAEYARSMMNYLIRHIKCDSKPLKIVLETNYYDFDPRKH